MREHLIELDSSSSKIMIFRWFDRNTKVLLSEFDLLESKEGNCSCKIEQLAEDIGFSIIADSPVGRAFFKSDE